MSSPARRRVSRESPLNGSPGSPPLGISMAYWATPCPAMSFAALSSGSSAASALDAASATGGTLGRPNPPLRRPPALTRGCVTLGAAPPGSTAVRRLLGMLAGTMSVAAAWASALTAHTGLALVLTGARLMLCWTEDALHRTQMLGSAATPSEAGRRYPGVSPLALALVCRLS